jgi:hypothetical protein
MRFMVMVRATAQNEAWLARCPFENAEEIEIRQI